MAELKIPQKTLQDNFNLQDFKDDFNALNSEIEENKTLTDSEISRLKEIANTWETFKASGGSVGGSINANNKISLTGDEISFRSENHNKGLVFNDKVSTIYDWKNNRHIFRVDDTNSTSTVYANDFYFGQYSKNTTGYTKLPNGLIMQWGKSTSWNGGKLWIEYPISFPSNVVNVSITSLENVNSGCKTIFSTPDVSNTGFNAVSNVNQIGFFWIAIGY